MDSGNKHERTSSCTEMLKRIDSLANQLSHNCTEIQDTAWQPGVPELAEQMGATVNTLQSEIAKLRDELTAMDGRHQKVILENERLRQIVASTGAMAMPPPTRTPVAEPLSSPGPSPTGVSSTSVARVASASVVPSAVVTGGATASTPTSAVTPTSSGRLSAGSAGSGTPCSSDPNAGSGNVCDVCMASFKSRQTLLQHRHIHDPAPRFCCQLCGNKFRQQSGLYQHMRVVHRKN